MVRTRRLKTPIIITDLFLPVQYFHSRLVDLSGAPVHCLYKEWREWRQTKYGIKSVI